MTRANTISFQRSPITAAVAAALTLAGAPGSAAAGTSVIALSGNAAPGTEPGVTFGFVGNASLNNASQVAFTSFLAGAGVTSANNQSIWRDTTLVAREGAAASAAGAGVNFGSLLTPLLNEAGQVAFSSSLTGTGVTTANDEAIWRDGTLIARTGNAAPGLGGVTFSFVSSNLRLSDAGHVVFSATLAGSGVTATNDNSLWSNSRLVAREGNPATAAGAGVDFAGSFGSPVVNDLGELAFTAFLTGTGVTSANDTSIWHDAALVAREGGAAPVAGGGVNFATLGAPVLNNAGQVAFFSALTGAGVTAGNDAAIFRDGALIAREGDAAAAGPGVAFGHLTNPFLNDAGQVAFNSALTGMGVTTANDSAIWRDGVLIVREGDAAPTAAAGGKFSSLAVADLNNTGQVLYSGFLTGTGVTADNDSALWIGDGIESLQVAREGDLVGSRTIVALGVGGSSLNDLGQVSYEATFTSGSGVFLFTPDLHYRSAFSSSWDNNANWTLGLGPAHVHDVFIDPSSSRTVTGPTGAETVKSLTVGGGAGIATLRLNGGALSAINGVTVASTGVLTGDGTITSTVTNQGTVRAQNVTVQGGLTNSGIVEGSGRINTALSNQSNGQVRVAATEHLVVSGSAHSNAGRIEVIGGTAEFNGAVTNQAGTGTITGRNATLRFNNGLNNQGSVALSFGISDVFGDINNTGSIINSGAGQVTFYDDVINNGEIRTSTGGASVFFGTVAGAGSFTGTGTVFLEGDLRPGNSPALVVFGGDVALGAASSSLFELGGLTRGSEYDGIDVAGALTLAGTLNIALLNAFDPQAGMSFDLFTAETIDGMFLQTLFPTLPGRGWSVSLLQDFFGSTDVLRLNVASAPAVPVPAAAWLLSSGLVGLIAVARRRHARGE